MTTAGADPGTATRREGTAFGARLTSDIPLPLAASSTDRSPPLRVSWGHPESQDPDCVALGALGAAVGIEGDVSPRAGTIWLRSTSAPLGLSWGAVLGLALPHLLYAGGTHVLHASCASLDGRAVAFLGQPRSGKSSTAAALMRQGWRLVSDDALPVTVSEVGALAHPAFPAIRLFTGTADWFADGDRERLVQIHPRLQKQWVHVDEDREWHGAGPVPLRCLCVLERSGAPSGRLIGRPAILAVLNATYQPPRVPEERLGLDFEAAHRLAAAVPVFRLALPNQIPPPPVLADRVLAELAALGAR